MRWARGLKVLAGVVVAVGASAKPADPVDLTIETEDGSRHAIVLPAGDGPHPVVIVLHGAFVGADMTRRNTGFAEAARRHGFTAIFPDGLNQVWHDGLFDKPDAPPPRPDDVGFLTGLIDRLVETGVADSARIYLAGISNGGMMAYKLACARPGLFAGLASVIAAMPADLGSCPTLPLPLVMINGSADPLIPYGGGIVGKVRHGMGTVLGVEATAARFAKADGCAARAERPLATRPLNDGDAVSRIAWTGCRADAGVTIYRIDGGDHEVPGAWPEGKPHEPHGPGEFVAADVVLDAFAGLAQR